METKLRVYNNVAGVVSIVGKPVELRGSVATNASGVARLYLTDDGTSTGRDLFKRISSYSADVEATVQVNSRTSNKGINFIDVTVTQLQFNGIVLLGFAVLGSVTIVPVVGATVVFTVFGD